MATTALLAWIDEPHPRNGISFAQDDGWDRWSYPDLAGFARRVSYGLIGAGVQPDDRVLVVQRSGPQFVATLFGTMLAGATPCPVAPPLLFQDPEQYARHLGAIVGAARPAAVVTEPGLLGRMSDLLPQQPLTVEDLTRDGGPVGHPYRRSPAASALLQFTSGSSGRARGVRLPFDALAANVAAIRRWLAMTEDDPTASWLPVHHDMGLIGCLITPVVNQGDLWLLEPERFVRTPTRYLRCFDKPGARLTAIPSFGLDHITRRVPPDALDGLDFSEWRAVIVGAERIDPATLDRFANLLAPFGLDRRALLPAYGLAEATLAVTGLALDKEFTTAAVDPRALSFGDDVRAATDSGVQHVVGCGPALAGLRVDVVDDEGVPLPDGHLGQIVVRGASIAAGYAGSDASLSLTGWHDGALHTGDAGFLVDGQLFVIGRLGDSMKIRGRTHFAEDIEAALVAAGLPRTRLAVLLGSAAAGPTAVVLIEQARDGWLDTARAVLRRTAEGADGVVLDVPHNTIQRTTSGKPKRRPMWQAYVDGRVAAPQPL